MSRSCPHRRSEQRRMDGCAAARGAGACRFERADRGTPTEEPTPPGVGSHARSVPPENAVQPMPAGAYDREAGSRAFLGMVERSRYAEELGFDWVSVSEHHYSPRILTPSLPIAAAYIASHVHNITIALLGT